jgi:hypothetical protein
MSTRPFFHSVVPGKEAAVKEEERVTEEALARERLLASRQLRPKGMNGKFGYANEAGEMVIPARFDAVYQDDGSWLPRDESIMALVREGSSWHCIDTKGESVTAFCLEPVEDPLPQPVQMGENRYGDR